MSHFKITDFTNENRPRERLAAFGPEALSDSELLAILLGSGTRNMNVLELANYILKSAGGLDGLRSFSAKNLNEIEGIGPARSAIILAAIELGRRFSKVMLQGKDRVIIRSAADIYDYKHYEMECLDHEELHVLSLDTKHAVIADDILYKGTLNSSAIRIAEVIRKPMMNGAACFVMVHNHPSGDPKPSTADILTTRSVREAGKSLDLQLLDHIIIGKGKYISVLEYID